jgi:uncharacterized protein (DUF2236 family)
MTDSSERFEGYRRGLATLAERAGAGEAGFFGPGSAAWLVNREAALGLGALRALLMQAAHPGVAEGVAEHSRYRQKPFERAYSTLRAQQAVVFGSAAEAMMALERMYARHLAVRGRDYQALDETLQVWVWATLVDSAEYAFEQFVRPLDEETREQLHRESRFFGQLLGIPGDRLPASRGEFQVWMAQQLGGGEIRVTPAARAIAAALFDLPTRAARRFNRRWAAATLPAPLRRGYGLEDAPSFSPRMLEGLRGIIGELPLRLRTAPVYWRAMARTRAGAPQARKHG